MSGCSIIILCFFISIMTFPSKSLEANTKSFHSFHLKGIKSSQRFQRNVLIIILSQVLQNFFQKYECLNSTWKALWNMSLFTTNPSPLLSSKTWSICWKLWARYWFSQRSTMGGICCSRSALFFNIWFSERKLLN